MNKLKVYSLASLFLILIIVLVISRICVIAPEFAPFAGHGGFPQSLCFRCKPVAVAASRDFSRDVCSCRLLLYLSFFFATIRALALRYQIVICVNTHYAAWFSSGLILSKLKVLVPNTKSYTRLRNVIIEVTCRRFLAR